MNNKITKIKKTKLIKYFVILFFLFLIWFLGTFWAIIKYDQSVLIMSFSHNTNDFTQINHEKLMKGQKISGEFVAKDDNLGIVSLRFKSFQRVSYKQEDKLIFRLKEKGAKDWYYKNQYRSGFIYDMPFLPFGFPIIKDSFGKTYVFELESLNGNAVNGVALSSREPILASKYATDRNDILHNPAKLVSFAFKKYFNSFQTIDIAYSSLIFALPFLFYIYWISPLRKKIIKPYLSSVEKKYTSFLRRRFGKHSKYFEKIYYIVSRNYYIIFLILFILIDVIFLQIYNDLLYIVVGVIWFVMMKINNIDSEKTFLIGLGILIFAPIYLQLNITNVAEKAGAWAFILFVVGLIQALYDLRRNDEVQ